VREGSIAGPLLALLLVLTGCGGNGQSATGRAEWSDANAQQLREAIDGRAKHALDRIRFPIEGEAHSSEGRAALTRSALRYATAVARGASDPAKHYEVYTVPRPRPDLQPALARALAEGNVGEWIDGLAPKEENYRKLSKAYLALRKPGSTTSAAIPDDIEPLNPGASDPRVPAIARQLVASDYLAPDAVQGERYSPAMVRAVKRMQADYGIDADGVIGEDALEILNLSDADREQAIAVAMERMRWLDRTPPATRIDVNLATARLTYWRDGKIADTRKVVVGKPENETPQLQSPIYRLVANPTWTVPRSIQTKEIAGKGSRYLRRNNMVWKDGWIVQQPGPKNALGLVKFDMKNDHQIYLHDTPAKPLFAEAQRQRSHGCVRVEDALGFAELLARDAGILDQWRKARATGKETFVPLPKEIPVRLFYQTVLFDEAGEPVIRADPYGWNDRVSAALGFPASTTLRLHPSASDVGP
jgi:murein L,D-transpeptidase YcbB/YkuD